MMHRLYLYLIISICFIGFIKCSAGIGPDSERYTDPVVLADEATPRILGNFNHYNDFSAIEMVMNEEGAWSAEISLRMKSFWQTRMLLSQLTDIYTKICKNITLQIVSIF